MVDGGVMTKRLSDEEKARRKAIRDAAKPSPEELRLRQNEARKRWFDKNPGYLAEYKRKKRKEYPEKVRAAQREEYSRNPESRRKSCRKWWASNSESQKPRLADWKYKNPDLYAAKIINKWMCVNKGEIPVEMISAKVQHLKLMWLLKGVNHEVIERHQDRHE